jgi:hypothetical protein
MSKIGDFWIFLFFFFCPPKNVATFVVFFKKNPFEMNFSGFSPQCQNSPEKRKC